jgi:hypothetical protein
VRNWVGQNNIKGGEPIGRDEQKSLTKIEYLADLAAAELFYAWKIDGGLWDGLQCGLNAISPSLHPLVGQARPLLSGEHRLPACRSRQLAANLCAARFTR